MINSGNSIYIGDIGLAIVCDMGVDTSAATEAYLSVRKPDGTEDKWTAQPHTVDGVPNYIIYTTREGDLDQRGRYRVQPRLKLSAWEGSGDTDEFRVEGRYR